MAIFVILAVFMMVVAFLTWDQNANLVTMCYYNYHVKVLVVSWSSSECRNDVEKPVVNLKFAL